MSRNHERTDAWDTDDTPATPDTQTDTELTDKEQSEMNTPPPLEPSPAHEPACDYTEGEGNAPDETSGEDAPAEEEEKFVPCRTYQVRMGYEAGFDLMKKWPCEGRTVHAGIGWFHPFGPSEYYGMANLPGNFFEESTQFPLENYFT